MRKIALITTSRAEYGIQARLIRLLQDDDTIDFSLIVSGTHLSRRHGMSVREIEEDGVNITTKVDLKIDEDSNVSNIMARALIAFGDVLNRLRPDICILLGDRYEMFAAALACTLNGILIAHLYGGETTEGAIDEVFRHSITKAAYLHFTSCEQYRNRVIQLGEAPERVFNVGSLGVENIHFVDLIPRLELAAELGIEFSKKNFLVTFHPVTMESDSALQQVDELLTALSTLSDSTIIFTHPNADAGGDDIAERIKQFVTKNSKSYLFKSLGRKRYFSLVKCVDAVVGNSSSGIVEVPSLGTVTINIGDRQKGRLQAASIFNCQADRESIRDAIDTVVDKGFYRLHAGVNPYEKPDTAQHIFMCLKKIPLPKTLKKQFYDIV